MRTADVVRHLQIVRAGMCKYPLPLEIDSLAVIEAWVLEGARLTDVVGVDPRVKAWLDDHAERPPEVARVVDQQQGQRRVIGTNRDGVPIYEL